MFHADETTIKNYPPLHPGDPNILGFVLPKTLKAARDFFDCDNIEYVPLEDEGGGGTLQSHWEARILKQEIMAGRIEEGASTSAITLALLELFTLFELLAVLAGDIMEALSDSL